jgi:hypothetical protein
MKTRTTLILLVIASMLGAGILILDRVIPSSREPANASVYIADFDPKDLDTLDIVRGESQISFRFNNDHWSVTTPFQDLADPRVIDQILRTAHLLHRDDTVAKLGKGNQRRKKLKSFGLLKSKLTLKLHGKNIQTTLDFGNDTAVAGKCYLRVKGKDPVFVVPDDLKSLLLMDQNSYRDHQLVTLSIEDISRITLRSPNGQMILSKQGMNWQLEQPIHAPANSYVVNEILNQIINLNIQSFLPPDNTTNTGLDTVTRSITLETGNEKTELDIGNTTVDAKLYVKVAGRPFILLTHSSLAKQLDLTPNDLRHRKLGRLNPDMIDRINIETPSAPKLVLGRHENHWVCLSDHNVPVNARIVQNLIDTINQQDITAFVDDSAVNLDHYGLRQPRAKVTFSDYSTESTPEEPAGEDPLLTIDIGRSENGYTYVRLEPEPYVVTIPDNTVSKLPLTEGAFR